ncbi:hypothetical protein H0E87_021349, partial [Populus deltoides]
EDLFEIQRRESENRRGEGKTRSGLSQQEKKDRSSPLAPPPCFLSTATTRPAHPATINAAIAKENREGRRETEQQRGKKKKQRPRARMQGGEEKTPRHRSNHHHFSSPYCPTTFHYRRTINGKNRTNEGEGQR